MQSDKYDRDEELGFHYQIHMAQNVSAMNQEIARLLNVSSPQFTSYF